MKHILFSTIIATLMLTTYVHLKYNGPRLLRSTYNGVEVEVFFNEEFSRITMNGKHYWGTAKYNVWQNSINFKSDSITLKLPIK
jgi:hypothetical protein